LYAYEAKRTLAVTAQGEIGFTWGTSNAPFQVRLQFERYNK
jgi:hypothetical protein